MFEIFEVQIEANPEILSLNMFKSDILNIRKVRSGSNIKLFEYFGQPSCRGWKKNQKSISVGPTFIPDYRVPSF